MASGAGEILKINKTTSYKTTRSDEEYGELWIVRTNLKHHEKHLNIVPAK